jgi:amyotrophic lateral sclerosis 2 protein
MSESANVIAWEEGEPAAALLAPEQAMTAAVSSRLGQVFFLTEDGRVYLSTLKQDGLSGKLQELALPCQTVVGIACNSIHTIFVTDRGRVLRSELETPEKVEELAIKQPNLCCPHGVVEDGGRLFVREVSSHSKNLLFISDSGKVWAVDESKSLLPDKLPAFENKVPISIMCGSNFSTALIQDCENSNDDSIGKPGVANSSKSSRDSLDKANSSKEGPLDGLCMVGSCLECREQSLLSLHTLDLNDSQRMNQEDFKDNVNSLAQVCWSKADHLVRQSALLLNSTPQLDAAKQFLTKQLSWVTGSESDDCNNSPGAASSLESGNNVTQQVASRVVEGVRNLGDAVNRMSRHWSGTSQEETPSVPAAAPVEVAGSETLSLPAALPSSSSGEDSPAAPATPRFIVRQSLQSHHRWKRNGSSSLSLDSTLVRMTDREKSTGLQPDRLVSLGRQLLFTSVWTWGQGGVGQLGLSDCVSREAPQTVRPLLGIGICKVVCGSRHSLALTLDGRVLAWGANNKGQVEPGEDLSFMSVPTEVSLPFRTTIRDIAAGRYTSVSIQLSL